MVAIVRTRMLNAVVTPRVSCELQAVRYDRVELIARLTVPV